ncbi:MAG TPA: Flp family type IVb pilin [Bacillota bacterium]
MVQPVREGLRGRARALAGYVGQLAGRVLGSARGATTAEYAMILALVVIVLLGTLTELGQALLLRLEDIVEQISTSGAGAP